MALPSNSLSTYGAVGNREDLIDSVYLVAQKDTPFTSRIAKVGASATYHEWQTQDLAAAVDSNAVLEGDDATTDAANVTTKLGNYTQISDKVARTTGTQEAVENAGNTAKMAQQKAIKMVELTRDIEKSALANKARVAGNTTTARVAAGIESWIVTNASEGATATSATGDGTDARVAGTPRAFSEPLLKTALAATADAGGDPDLILVGSFNKQAMSAFTGNGITRNVEANRNTLDTAIDIYVSDFGTMEVVYSPQSNAASALVIDTELFALASLPGRMFKETPLAKTGDTDRVQVLCEWTLESRNEKGSTAVYDLTTS